MNSFPHWGSAVTALLCLFFTSSLLATVDNCAVCDVNRDRAALIDLYNATNGGNWTNNTNWNTANSIDTWHGVTTNIDGCVRHIQLSNNNLSGSLPSSIDDLTELDLLDLANNQLIGSIPSTIGNLTRLRLLSLHGNQLVGTLPTTIGNLSNLLNLYLQNNSLSGAIPSQIDGAVSLVNLNFRNNDFTGSIPATIGDLTQLVTLNLSQNDLTGSIPIDIGELTNLKLLYLEQNDLSGSIPTEMGQLTELIQLWLFENQLTGSIPNELGNLSKVQLFRLGHNNLTGNIPPELGNLANVVQFWLHDNQLTGSIPTELGNLPTMTYLKLDFNQLTGTIPASLANNQALQFMHLRNNDLNGTLPPEFARLTDLQQLYFGNNPNLVGCIPHEYTVFCDLGTQVTINATGLDHVNFANFCSDGLGSCVENDVCFDAISLPMNQDICGSNAIKSLVNGMTESFIRPACEFADRDIWFKVVVPPTQNFKVQFTPETTIRPSFAAYRTCDEVNLIECDTLDEATNAIFFDEDQVVAGQTIFLQIWDRDNAVLNTSGLHYLELSAHELPADKTEWQDCENRLTDIDPNGGGKYNATEFIIQFEPGTTAAEIATLRTTNFPQVTLNKICPCQPRLQVWGEGDPVMMEACKKGSRASGKVDTTVYNYVFEPIEFEPVVDEIGDDLLPSSTYIDVAVAPNGDFTVGYKHTDLQRFIAYDRFGQPKSVQNNLLDGFGSNNLTVPSLSINENGELAIISTNEGTSCNEFVLHKFNENGNNIFSKNLLSVVCPSSNYNVKIANLANGDVVAIWENEEMGSGGVVAKVFMQIFHPNGIAKTTVVEVDSPINRSNLPKIMSSAAGTFTVAYQVNFDHALNELEGVVKRFANDGMLLNTYTMTDNAINSHALTFDINTNDNGESIMVWQDPASNDQQIFSRKITAAGALQPVIGLGKSAPYGLEPRVVLLNDGTFVSSWVEEVGNVNKVFAQRFHADGIPIAEPYLVSDNIIVHPTSLNMKLGHDNSLIFAWIDDGNERIYVLVDRAGEKVSSPNQPRNTSFNYTPTLNAPKVLVAVADSGIKSDHPYFENALWQSSTGGVCLSDNIGHNLTKYDLQNQLYNDPFPDDIDQHGTGVNGVIIESFPNEIKLDLMNIKFYEDGKSTLFDGVCGIYYAIEEGADIINLSWGFEAAEPPAVLRDALLKAQGAGILVVTSAGNTAKNNDEIKKYPANYSTDLNNIITVTAFDHVVGDATEIKLAEYASFGENKVDIAAKGFVETAALNYPSNPTPTQLRQTLVGTSLAAPAVTKIAAIIMGEYPQLTYREVKDCILNSAAAVTALQTQVATGGILDSLAALNCAATKAAAIDAACAQTNLSLTTNSTAEGCARKDGAIDLIVSGTNTGLTYEWSNGATTKDIDELIADTYFVTVTNAEGCIKTLRTEVDQACALPLELLAFTATAQTQAIQLEWTVMTNEVVQYFNLLRSTDGTNFSTITTLAPAATRAAQYQFTDKNIVAGRPYYYQLETVEQTGEISTSPIRSAQLAAEDAYQFYPNPTTGMVHFEMPESGGVVTLELYNYLGQLVQMWKNEIGDNVLNISDLASGVYNMKIKVGERVIGVEKLILQ